MPWLLGAFSTEMDANTLSALNDNLGIGEAFIQTSVQDLSGTLGSFASAILPYLVGVAGAFLVFWLLKLALRVVKSVAK